MDTTTLVSLKHDLGILEREQSISSKKIISNLRIRILGGTSVLFGFIVLEFFQNKFSNDNNRVILYGFLISIGIATWIVGFIKMNSAKKSLVQTNSRIEQLKKEIINAKEN